MYIYIYICIIISTSSSSSSNSSLRRPPDELAAGLSRAGSAGAPDQYTYLHSAKGGAVATGCSDLYGVVYYFTV